MKEKMWSINVVLHNPKFWLLGVMHTTESKFSNFEIEVLSEIEIEKTLACWSGAQMGSSHEKMEVKNLVTHSL